MPIRIQNPASYAHFHPYLSFIFLVSSRQSLRGCLLAAVELEPDEDGEVREVGAKVTFQVTDPALPLVDLGTLGRDSLQKSLEEKGVSDSISPTKYGNQKSKTGFFYKLSGFCGFYSYFISCLVF